VAAGVDQRHADPRDGGAAGEGTERTVGRASRAIGNGAAGIAAVDGRS